MHIYPRAQATKQPFASRSSGQRKCVLYFSKCWLLFNIIAHGVHLAVVLPFNSKLNFFHYVIFFLNPGVQRLQKNWFLQLFSFICCWAGGHIVRLVYDLSISPNFVVGLCQATAVGRCSVWLWLEGSWEDLVLEGTTSVFCFFLIWCMQMEMHIESHYRTLQWTKSKCTQQL